MHVFFNTSISFEIRLIFYGMFIQIISVNLWKGNINRIQKTSIKMDAFEQNINAFMKNNIN